MAIRIEHVGDVAVVIAEGNFIDEEHINELDRALTKLVVDDEHRKTLLNMEGVERMVTRGVAVIVHAHYQAVQRGATLYVCGRPSRPTGLTVMGGHAWLNHFDTCDEALKALQEV